MKFVVLQIPAYIKVVLVELNVKTGLLLNVPYGAKFWQWKILMNQGWENFDE